MSDDWNNQPCNLWFRAGHRRKWRVIASGTRQECERVSVQSRESGDYYVAAVGVDPNKRG